MTGNEPPSKGRRTRARRSALARLSEAERARVHEIMMELDIRRDDPDWVLLLEAGLVRDAIGDAKTAFRHDATEAVEALRAEVRRDSRKWLRQEATKIAAAAVLAADVIAGTAGWVGYATGRADGRAAAGVSAIAAEQPLSEPQTQLLRLIGRNIENASAIMERCRANTERQGDGDACMLTLWRKPPAPR